MQAALATREMAQTKRRYTSSDGIDYIVTVSWDERKLDKAHWFEAKVEAIQEGTDFSYPFPPEIATFRIGEIEHSFRQYVDIDWAGDREAAINHFLGTIYRRVYDYLERGR